MDLHPSCDKQNKIVRTVTIEKAKNREWMGNCCRIEEIKGMGLHPTDSEAHPTSLESAISPCHQTANASTQVSCNKRARDQHRQ